MTKKKKIIPLGKYTLVKPVEAQSAIQSAAGLSVPAKTEKEQRSQGVVVAISETSTHKDILKKGDLVAYGTYAGESLVDEEKEELKLLHDEDIIAKLE